MSEFVTLTIPRPIGSIPDGIPRPPLNLITISLPIIEVASNLVMIPAPTLSFGTVAEIVQVSGSLYQLTSGLVGVVLSNKLNETISTLAWNAAGLATVTMGTVTSLVPDDILRVGIVRKGTGAQGLYVNLWMAVPAIPI